MPVETITVAMTTRQRALLRDTIRDAYRARLRSRENVGALVDARDLFDLAMLFGVATAELAP